MAPQTPNPDFPRPVFSPSWPAAHVEWSFADIQLTEKFTVNQATFKQSGYLIKNISKVDQKPSISYQKSPETLRNMQIWGLGESGGSILIASCDKRLDDKLRIIILVQFGTNHFSISFCSGRDHEPQKQIMCNF